MRVKEIIRSKRFRFLGALASAGLIGVFLGAVGSGELQGAERPPSEKVAPPAPLPAPGIVGLVAAGVIGAIFVARRKK